MIILIQNTSNTDRNICRFGGEEIRIPTKDFITFDCTDFDEGDFWTKQSTKVIDGIKVIVDPKTIKLYKKLKANGKYESLISTNEVAKVDIIKTVDTNIKDATEQVDIVEPIVSEPIQEPVSEEIIEAVLTEEINPVVSEPETIEVEDIVADDVEDVPTGAVDVVKTDSTEIEYTEEYLNTLSKNELYSILDGLNITYKRNNSVSKLVSLILGNNSED